MAGSVEYEVLVHHTVDLQLAVSENLPSALNLSLLKLSLPISIEKSETLIDQLTKEGLI